MSATETSLQQGEVAQNRRLAARSWVYPVLLVLISLLVVIPYFPPIHRVPEVSSGASLYIGSRIPQGQVPYRDIWDFRPPLIFFLDALGWSLGGSSLWGIWILELAAIAATGLVLFRFLRRYFGAFLAAAASAGAILTLAAVENYGNLPEEFALPLQVGLLLLLVSVEDRPRSGWLYFSVGIGVGLLTSLRLTLFGTGFTLVLYLLLSRLVRRDGRGLLRLLWVAVGFGMVWIGWFACFSAAHALPEFVDQVFRYQLFYLQAGNPQRLSALFSELNQFFHGSAFLAVGLVAWLAVVPFMLFQEAGFRRVITSRGFGAAIALPGLGLILNGVYDDASGRLFGLKSLSFYRMAMIAAGLLLGGLAVLIVTGRLRAVMERWLRKLNPGDSSGLLLPLFIALFDLPVQLALACIPGRADAALFLPVIPSVAILACFLFWSFMPVSSPDPRRSGLWLFLFVLVFSALSTGIITAWKGIPPKRADEITDLVKYLQENARPADTLFVWSGKPQVYVVTGRQSASRYLDLRPLFTRGYTSPERIQSFFEEIRTARPEFLISTRSWNEPLLLPDDPAQCSQLEDEAFIIKLQERDRFRWENTLIERPYVPQGMRPVYRWICENYERSNQLGSDPFQPWFVYRLRQATP